MPTTTLMEESDPPAAVVVAYEAGCEMMTFAVEWERPKSGKPGFVTVTMGVAAGGEDVVVALLEDDAEYLMRALGDALAAARGRRRGGN